MKDNIIFPGLYAFQFRLDFIKKRDSADYVRIDSYDETTYEYYYDRVKKFLKNFTQYHIYIEKGEKSQKIHLQGILWSHIKYNTKIFVSLKAKYFIRNRKIKNSCSITDANKILNLSAYCSKGAIDNLKFSTLSADQISLIPRWKKAYSASQWKQMVKEKIDTIKNQSPNNFAVSLCEFYWENDRRQPTRAQLIYYLGLYHEEYSAQDYINSLRLFHSNSW